MSLKSTDTRYGAVAIVLHWLSALLILMLLALGFASAFSADPAIRLALLRLHAPLGLLVLALTLLRLGWWLFADRAPHPLTGMSPVRAALERGVRTLLYLVILLMGVSGVGLVALSGAAKPLLLGAAGPLPQFDAYAPLAMHLSAAVALMALVGLHILAALYHQLARRDHLLARMRIGG